MKTLRTNRFDKLITCNFKTLILNNPDLCETFDEMITEDPFTFRKLRISNESTIFKTSPLTYYKMHLDIDINFSTICPFTNKLVSKNNSVFAKYQGYIDKEYFNSLPKIGLSKFLGYINYLYLFNPLDFANNPSEYIETHLGFKTFSLYNEPSDIYLGVYNLNDFNYSLDLNSIAEDFFQEIASDPLTFKLFPLMDENSSLTYNEVNALENFGAPSVREFFSKFLEAQREKVVSMDEDVPPPFTYLINSQREVPFYIGLKEKGYEHYYSVDNLDSIYKEKFIPYQKSIKGSSVENLDFITFNKNSKLFDQDNLYLDKKYIKNLEIISERPLDCKFFQNTCIYYVVNTDSTLGYCNPSKRVLVRHGSNRYLHNVNEGFKLKFGSILDFPFSLQMLDNILSEPNKFLGNIEYLYLQNESRKRTTPNQEGRLSDYTTDVLKYREGFLSLEKEQESVFGKDPIYLGIELEGRFKKSKTIENFSDFIKLFSRTELGDKHTILKRDSSTGPDGFEMVTIPATLSYHKKMFKPFFSNIKGMYKYMIARPNPTGTERWVHGLHVHIGKSCFTRLSLGKFIGFLSKKDNASFLEQIAGRPPNTYCPKLTIPDTKNVHGVDLSVKVISNYLKVVSRNLVTGSFAGSDESKTGELIGSVYKGKDWKEHSVSYANYFSRGAINCSKPKTVEVRMFGSTNKKAEFFMRIEFVDALVRYCKHVAGINDLTVPKFIDYLLEPLNQKRYFYLMKFLAKQNYVERTVHKSKKTGKLHYKYYSSLDYKSKVEHIEKQKKKQKDMSVVVDNLYENPPDTASIARQRGEA